MHRDLALPFLIATDLALGPRLLLQFHLENLTDGTAELAHNCLGILHRVGCHVKLSNFKPEDAATILGAVVACIAVRLGLGDKYPFVC